MELSSALVFDALQTVLGGSDACLVSLGTVSDAARKPTLVGADKPGLLPTAIAWLFRLVDELRQRPNRSRFCIRMSAVGVSGDTLTDLLAEANGAGFDSDGNQLAPHSAGLADDAVHGVQLLNVNELRAAGLNEALGFLARALQRRTSHLFVTLHVYQYLLENANAVVSGGRCKLHLVDLADKSGTLSLNAMGNVLLALLQGQRHVPFR